MINANCAVSCTDDTTRSHLLEEMAFPDGVKLVKTHEDPGSSLPLLVHEEMSKYDETSDLRGRDK